MEQCKIYGHEYSMIGYKYVSHDICDDLIQYWEDHYNDPAHSHGGITAGGLNKDIKDSHDINVDLHDTDPRIVSYLKELKTLSDCYIEQYPVLREVPWSLTEGFNIQRYNPSQGYHKLHYERGHPMMGMSGARILVWMTYLNDVHEDGETHFPYQNLKVKPEKGLTLVWPADWTHSHHGIPAPKEEKNIITGWYNLV